MVGVRLNSAWTVIFIFILQTLFPPVATAQTGSYLEEMDVRQKLNEVMPLELTFTDEQGNIVALKQYFGDQPVLLTFVYFTCPMLCPLNIRGLANSLKVLKENPGENYELLVVSFDPEDTSRNARQRKEKFLEELNKPGAGGAVHFLTGDASTIQKATSAAGFKFVRMKDSGEYAHPSVLLVLPPQGRISRYMFGLDYPPRDIRLSLTDARQEKSGSLADKVLMYCFKYDPHLGRYSLAVMNLLKFAALLTVLLLAGFIYLLRRQEQKA